MGARGWFDQLGPIGCLKCGRLTRMRLHDVVSRYCGSQSIQVPVVGCPACGAEFRILPSLVVPYKQHAAGTLQTALEMLKAGRGWRRVARAVGVSVPLLKRWSRWWRQAQDVMWSQIQARLSGMTSVDRWRRDSRLVDRLLEFPHWTGPARCRA